MSEKIISITEVLNSDELTKWSNWDGYEIATDNQKIKLMIENQQSCCESWGYFMSQDDTDQFIGAEIIDITLTDTALNTVKLKEKYMEEKAPYVYDGGIIFVNINTTKGLLQFCAYNEHNGYYGHDVRIVSEQLKYEESL